MVVVLDGLLAPPQFGLRVAAAEVGRGMIGVMADCAVVVGDDFLVAVQPGVGPGALGIEPGIVRVQADRLGAIGDGLFEPVQISLIKTEAGPACRAAAVVRREGIAEDLQPWRCRGASTETAVGACPRAGFSFHSSEDEKRRRLESFVGLLSNPCESGEQARRREAIAARWRRSDARLGRENVETGLEPEPADPDHDAEHDET